jgi:hypothetical protein
MILVVILGKSIHTTTTSPRVGGKKIAKNMKAFCGGRQVQAFNAR